MRLFQLFVTAIVIIAPLFSGVAAEVQPFLGQTPPGLDPMPFVAEILTAEKHPHGQFSLSSDMKEAFWSAMLADGPTQTIFFSTFDGTMISRPAVAPFAADSGNGGPVFSADGKRVYFSAEFPATGGATSPTTAICCAERTASGWGKPVVIDGTSDTLMTKGQVTIAASGNIYFSGRVLTSRKPTIYICEFVDGSYKAPRELTGPISSLPLCLDPWVDPDEKFLLVSCPPPSGSPMRTDIGISHRQSDGGWSLPVSIGSAVNTDAFERFASLTPDGRYLFFIRSTSERFVGDGANFFWVDAKILDGLR